MTRLDTTLMELEDRKEVLLETIENSKEEIKTINKERISEGVKIVSKIEKYANTNLSPVTEKYRDSILDELRQFFYDSSERKGLEIYGPDIGGLKLFQDVDYSKYEEYAKLRKKTDKLFNIGFYSVISIIGMPAIFPALIAGAHLSKKANKIESSLDSLDGMEVAYHFSEKMGEI